MKRSRRSIANDKHRAPWCIAEIGSLKFGVYLVDATKFPELSKDVGYFDSAAGVILISWDIPHELAESTLIHEMGHAALYTSGASLRGAKEHTSEHEEQMVNLFCSQLYDALKRNGMLTFPPRPETPR